MELLQLSQPTNQPTNLDYSQTVFNVPSTPLLPVIHTVYITFLNLLHTII